ncbi:MAG TPA: tetratricopeptide repeat protein, partial [Phycisphaerae bacterium]|nr:tetratricopeptide repeat protein [Phycisphaerae bacterium]
MSANDPQSEPMTVQQALNAAIEHHQAGSLAEAEAIYRQVLARQPDNTDALHLLGMIAHQMGKNQDAQELITRAININPITAVYYNNLGNVFTALGKTNESLHAYRTAIEFEPNYADAHNNLGGSLQTLGKFEDAVGAYRTALQLQPDSAHIYNNLGHALANGGQLDAAINAYRRAIKLKPDFADAYDNLGIALANSGQLDAAIEAYRAALRYKPDKHQIHSGLIHTMYFHPGFDDRAIHEEFVLWNQQHVEPLSKFIQPHTNPDSHRDDPERRLKIGYVSPDFRQHVVGWNLFPLLREHDRKDFEIICYSGVLRPDDMTDRIRVCANGWRSIVNITDEQVAQMIRDDQIDILVDLTMHMANNRLLVFARKPAP